MQRIAKLIASFFYVGYIPIIPGTFGSLAAFAIYFPLLYLHRWDVYAGIVVIVTLLGIWAADVMERESKIIDPSFVVIDEVAGQLITLFLLPFSWVNALIGFILFRALDIVKPFPARQAENLHGGWGIMMDDVMSGIYGCLIMHLGNYAIHKL